MQIKLEDLDAAIQEKVDELYDRIEAARKSNNDQAVMMTLSELEGVEFVYELIMNMASS